MFDMVQDVVAPAILQIYVVMARLKVLFLDIFVISISFSIWKVYSKGVGTQVQSATPCCYIQLHRLQYYRSFLK